MPTLSSWSSALPTLFLDFDGLRHPLPPPVREGRGKYRAPFDRADVLAAALAGVAVEIVLSTSWVTAFGRDVATEALPESLRHRVVGATADIVVGDPGWLQLTRYQQVRAYVERHAIVIWIAIDDDAEGWPDDQRHRLLCTQPEQGVTAD